MDALKRTPHPRSRDELQVDGRLRAFRATDAFALEVFHAVRALARTEGDGLAREIRRVAARVGGALVAASSAERGGEEERRGVAVARAGLLEVRYYLYLARRLGFLELKRYRTLVANQDVALRELESLVVQVAADAERNPERIGGPSPRGARDAS